MPDPVGYFNVVTYDFGAGSGLGGGPENGNVVLSGHVDCGRCYNGGSGIAVLWYVRNLQLGDRAQYYAADGKVYNYEVISSRSVSSATNFVPIVASGAADMTVITCTGTFAGGEYDQRHVVQFRKIAG
jgi:sortase (surface protein transpeptidase)